MKRNIVERFFVNLALLTIALAIVFTVSEIVAHVLYKDDMVLFPRYHANVKYGKLTLRRIRSDSRLWHASVDGRWKFTTNHEVVLASALVRRMCMFYQKNGTRLIIPGAPEKALTGHSNLPWRRHFTMME